MAEYEWQLKFSEALALLESERSKMLENNTFKQPEDLFEWAETVAKKTIEISSACDGGELALLVCDKIALETSGEEYLNKIIEHGRSLGVVSNVQTESAKYTATVVLSIYLDDKGLGQIKSVNMVE